MVRNISQIVYQLFQKETLDEVSESELRYFIRQYPYAGTGHLLLAKKLQLEGERRAFEREIAVTSIYFNNPAWLRFILQEPNGTSHHDSQEPSAHIHSSDIVKQADPELSIHQEDIKIDEQEVHYADESIAEESIAEESIVEESIAEESTAEESIDVSKDEINNSTNIPVSSNELFYDDGEVFAEFIVEEANEEIRLNEETLNAPWEMEEEGSEENNRSEEDEPVSDEELRENFEKRKHLTSEVVAGLFERHESANREQDIADSERPGHEGEYSDDQMVDRPDLISFEAQKASQRDPLPVEIENIAASPLEVDESQNAAQPDLAAKDGEAADLQKLEFDPYHTIDYFASQGIKLRLEDFSRDKLGQQLKSFTEWIRSMKRLPQQVAENMMDETDQRSIRRIAEHSVEEKEVLTESMAEVWVKQGNYEKARQIYRKLSLQNPSKSTYFAAKIDQLKVL